MLLECRALYLITSSHLCLLCCLVSMHNISAIFDITLSVLIYSNLILNLDSITIASAMVVYRLYKVGNPKYSVAYSPLPTSVEIPGSVNSSFEFLVLFSALSKLGLIMVFFYLCDRYAFLNQNYLLHLCSLVFFTWNFFL